MTRDEILAMKPGRELDTLVAEKIMGFIKDENDLRAFQSIWSTGYYNYSTDIAYAWTVMNELRTLEGHIQIGFVSRLHEIVGVPFGSCLKVGEELRLINATPEERCKAALLAVMVL